MPGSSPNDQAGDHDHAVVSCGLFALFIVTGPSGRQRTVVAAEEVFDPQVLVQAFVFCVPDVAATPRILRAAMAAP
jgi:hypothetical protein